MSMHKEGFCSSDAKEAYIQKTFSSIAGNYDKLNAVMTFKLDRRWREKTALATGLGLGGNALDVCCGTGDLAQALAERCGNRGGVTALDFNADMLAQAKEKQSNGFLSSRIRFIQGNAMELPFPDHTFDTATIGFALRNVPDYVHVLKEMTRVVRPGGTVVTLETSKPQFPLLKELHHLYMSCLVPVLGQVLAGDAKAYGWLAKSTAQFASQKELKAQMTALGLRQVRYVNLVGGVAAIHVGVKP